MSIGYRSPAQRQMDKVFQPKSGGSFGLRGLLTALALAILSGIALGLNHVHEQMEPPENMGPATDPNPMGDYLKKSFQLHEQLRRD